MRLFLAIDVPDLVRPAAAIAQRSLSEFNEVVKWVEPENLHLTVEFIGEVGPDHFTELTRKYERRFKGVASFRLKLGQKISFYPCATRPRVIVVKASTVGRIRGLPKEFHLTLGRIRPRATADQRDQLARQARPVRLDRLAGLVFAVHQIKLKESRLTPQGPSYIDREKFLLANQERL